MKKLNFMSKLGGNKGAVAIAFALTLPVLAICTAVAVNLGMCYLTEEQLQMALDAAASAIAISGLAPFQEPSYGGNIYWNAQMMFVYTFCAYPASYYSCTNSWRFQPRLNGNGIHYTGFDGYGRLHITAAAYAPLMSLWGLFPTQQRIVANSVVVFAQSGSGKK